MDWIEICIAIGLAAGGWCFAFWVSHRQIRETFENSARLERERTARDLSLTSVQELTEALTSMNRKYIEFTSWLGAKVASFEITVQRGYIPPEAADKFREEFLQRCNEAMNQGAIETYVFESRRVVLNEFIPFQDAISEQYLKFMESLGHMSLCMAPSSEAEVRALREHHDVLSEIRIDIICYVDDFIKELQNKFHSPMFGYTIPPRVPTDPQYKVLRLGQIEGKAPDTRAHAEGEV